ncbi:MAG: DUF262 domain-containing protein [Candidatus Thiodiazotropha sp.]
MANQYSPEKKTVGNLLSTTNPPIVVPDWQRSYSWTTSEVETFWRDLLAFSDRYPNDGIKTEEYFLGSVVIVNSLDEHLLLDGQQRLSTAAILLSVVRENLKRYSQDASTRTQARYLGDFDDAKNEYLYKISLNVYDRDYFKRIILEARDASYSEPEPTLSSHSRIKKARVFLEQEFQAKFESVTDHEEFHNWVLRIQRVLTNHFSVVAVFSQDEDNASAVFETLNDRGIGLSTADLVRNLLLRRAPQASREEIIDLWHEILGVETDAPLKSFLRHYWISHFGDIKTQSLYREIKATIQDENIDSLELSRKLRDSCIVYREIVSAHTDNSAIEKNLKNIKELGANILQPVLLSVLEQIDPDELPDILSALENAFVRHSVIGQLENSKLENILYRLAREFRTGKTVQEAIQEMANFLPSDEAFTNSFRTSAISRRATARYILRALEHDLRTTEELQVAPPDKVHVEHIYPQTPQAGERLTNHSQIIDRLGNLTLLSKRLNVTIRNSPFPDKKPYYNKSELLLTNSLVQHEEWNSEKIDARQLRLSERAPEIWKLPGS